MKYYRFIFSLSLVCTAVGTAAQAQTGSPVQTVKDLYAAAAYEDALAVVSRAPADVPNLELEQYRAFCLFALGRGAEAQKAIERLMAVDPLYLPDPAETSPRVQEAFTQARMRVLPDVTKRVYAE